MSQQEGETPFESEVKPNVPPEAKSPADPKEGDTGENGDLALCHSVLNTEESINSGLVCNMNLFEVILVCLTYPSCKHWV